MTILQFLLIVFCVLAFVSCVIAFALGILTYLDPTDPDDKIVGARLALLSPFAVFWVVYRVARKVFIVLKEVPGFVKTAFKKVK